MTEPRPRRAAANHNRDRPRRAPSLAERPDRIALWAVVLAVVAMIAGAASARAGGGGIGGVAAGSGADSGAAGDAGSPASDCPDTEFGRRTLKVGDCGDDVATLNWILRSNYREAPLAEEFAAGTETAVSEFQGDAGLSEDGIVDETTGRALVRGMSKQRATWYGPGLYGNAVACGGTLERDTLGVAHKTLPCGSKVAIRYRGHYVRTRVIDRGPFSGGFQWDLTQAAADRIGLEQDGAGTVRVAVISKRRR